MENLRFVVQVPGHAAQSHTLVAPNSYTLGRSESCDIIISSTSVSRTPIRIEWNGSVFEFVDAGVRTAVVINGYPLAGRRAIRTGDSVAIGDVTIAIQPAIDPAATVIGRPAAYVPPPVYAQPSPPVYITPPATYAAAAPAAAAGGARREHYIIGALAAIVVLGGIAGLAFALGVFSSGDDVAAKPSASASPDSAVAAATQTGSATASQSPSTSATTAVAKCAQVAVGCDAFVINSPLNTGAASTQDQQANCLSFRAAPSPSGQLISNLCDGDVVQVIGGPVDADGYRWWQVLPSADTRERVRRTCQCNPQVTEGYVAEYRGPGGPGPGAAINVGPWLKAQLPATPTAATPTPANAPTAKATATSTAEVRRQPSNNYGIYERVKFAAGANKARVSGGVAATTVNGYVFGASAGQVLHLTFTDRIPRDPSGSGAGVCEWEVFGPGDTKLNPASSSTAGQITEQFYRLTAGDQLMVISRGPAGCSYDADIEIN